MLLELASCESASFSYEETIFSYYVSMEFYGSHPAESPLISVQSFVARSVISIYANHSHPWQKTSSHFIDTRGDRFYELDRLGQVLCLRFARFTINSIDSEAEIGMDVIF